MLSIGSWIMIAFYVIALGGGSAILIGHALKNKHEV